MSYQQYLRDIFDELLERSRAARTRVRTLGDGDEKDKAFASGVAQGYYEVISHLLNQLDAFDISRANVGVPEDYSPEEDVL